MCSSVGVSLLTRRSKVSSDAGLNTLLSLMLCLLIATFDRGPLGIFGRGAHYVAAYDYCPNFLGDTADHTVVVKRLSSTLTGSGIRIGGGTEAGRNEFPWQAFVKIIFWTGEAAVCGGTYIGNDWVLTAAHCFLGATDVKVYLGAHNVDALDDDTNVQAFEGRNKIIFHPDWSFGDVENDIAILKLSSSPLVNEFVARARLPFSDDADLIGEEITMSGWGNYSATAGSTSPVLRKATSTVISSTGTDGECQRLTGQLFHGEKILCSDGSEGKRYCYGDDGGPMSHFRPEEGDDWFVVGVAGFGKRSSDCFSSPLPNVYTRVQHYLSWIYNNTDLVPEFHKTTTSAETTTEPTTTTTVSNIFTCSGQPDGYYVNPLNPCSAIYYQCLNGKRTEYTCASGLVFNVNICACDLPVNIPACTVRLRH